jgi:hypothetical protein
MMKSVFALDKITGMLMPRDKAMGDLWTNARKRKVGADPDFDNFMRLFLPQASTPDIPPPPAAGNEGPGFFESMFGGDDAGSPGAVSPRTRSGSGPATPRPRFGPTTPGGRGAASRGAASRGVAPPAPAIPGRVPIEQMTQPEIQDLLNSPDAANLSAEDMARIEQRLRQLGL